MNCAFGWLKDYPDIRDFDTKSPDIQPFVLNERLTLPVRYDIGETTHLPPIVSQGKIGSCTAHAGTCMYSTYLRVADLRSEPLSRRFLYKTTRDLLGWMGDTGAYLRTTMQSMAMFGVPPEKYYEYDIELYDDEPPARIYAMAQNYQALKYYRLDPLNKDNVRVLESIKYNLSANRACIFGFMVYDSINNEVGDVVMPNKNDQRKGGHAVCAIGYNDEYTIYRSGHLASRGAIKFANSWSTEWGQDGFGWLPYDYVLHGLAVDWWTIMSAEWLDTKQFA